MLNGYTVIYINWIFLCDFTIITEPWTFIQTKIQVTLHLFQIRTQLNSWYWTIGKLINRCPAQNIELNKKTYQSTKLTWGILSGSFLISCAYPGILLSGMPNHYSVCEIENNLTMTAAKTVSFMIKHERTKHFRSRTESKQQPQQQKQ